jgi:hypothetical protein
MSRSIELQRAVNVVSRRRVTLAARNNNRAHLSFPDAAGFAGQLPQIKEFRTANAAAANHGNAANHWAMQRKNPFNTNAVGNFPNREALAYAAPTFGDTHTSKA